MSLDDTALYTLYLLACRCQSDCSVLLPLMWSGSCLVGCTATTSLGLCIDVTYSTVEASCTSMSFTPRRTCRHTSRVSHRCRVTWNQRPGADCVLVFPSPRLHMIHSHRPVSQQLFVFIIRWHHWKWFRLLLSTILFHGLSRSCVVLKWQKILTWCLLHTTVPCLSQIALKFGLHQSTPSFCCEIE